LQYAIVVPCEISDIGCQGIRAPFFIE
jgi:hypothetical protein